MKRNFFLTWKRPKPSLSGFEFGDFAHIVPKSCELLRADFDFVKRFTSRSEAQFVGLFARHVVALQPLF